MADTVTVLGPERTVDTASDAWAGARVNADLTTCSVGTPILAR
jgi:hypothetical protein